MVEVINSDHLFFTNTYLVVNGDKCVVVDPGLNFKKAADKIKAKYKVEAILLTHGHLDHIDGIRYFDCPIYIHNFDSDCLFDDNKSLYQMMNMQNPLKNMNFCINKIKNNDIISLIGYEFKVIHTPGHTSGSVCYLSSEGLFSGDTLFQASYGRTDFPSGSYDDINSSIKYLSSIIDDKLIIYPGHGSTTTMALERRYNPCLR